MSATRNDAPPADLLQGTLNLLVLKALSLEPMHGWAISHRIRQASSGVLEVNQGSLYPALHRLENRGWIDGEWRATESNRRARYYTLTAAGRRELAKHLTSWRRFSGAIDAVLVTDT